MQIREKSAFIESIGKFIAERLEPFALQLAKFNAHLAEIEAGLIGLQNRAPEKGERGPPGDDGKDGASITVDDVAPMVAAEVTKAVAEIPTPQNGTDGINGKNGADGKDGRDGVGLAGAIIDRSGHLILTLTDGTTRDLGLIVGKDGEPGKPGADGLGWDDMTEELEDGGRTIVRRYMRGDQVKEFRHTMAVVLDQGVYKDGRDYAPGDGVTYDGSFWIAQEKTADRPDTGKGWRLAVKRGRNGKDGVMKTESPKVPLQVG